MVATYGPCEDWPVTWPCDVSAETPAVTGQAVAAATEILWALSGRQFGLCTVMLRPCRYDCGIPGGWFAWPGYDYPRPALIGGLWFNLTCSAGCRGSCACTELQQVYLPAPVYQITQVKVDGVVLTGSAYRLDDAHILVRVDGGAWPYCQELNLADTEVGTWAVTARYGQAPPTGAAGAIGELACEFIRGWNGADCRLPRGVTQLVRQGVTIQFPDMSELFKLGLTGMPIVDQFIMAWNPHGLARRAGVYSVDRMLHRRVGT